MGKERENELTNGKKRPLENVEKEDDGGSKRNEGGMINKGEKE